LSQGLEYTGEEPFNYFVTLFYPADNLKILDCNRCLKTLEGNSTEEFIAKLKENFEISVLPEGADTHPPGPHKFTLLIDN
jgi:uncharacterized protein (DUF1015 family)